MVAQLADAGAIVADGVALEAALNVGVAVVVGDHCKRRKRMSKKNGH